MCCTGRGLGTSNSLFVRRVFSSSLLFSSLAALFYVLFAPISPSLPLTTFRSPPPTSINYPVIVHSIDHASISPLPLYPFPSYSLSSYAMTLRIISSLYLTTYLAAHFTMFRGAVTPSIVTSAFTLSEK